MLTIFKGYGVSAFGSDCRRVFGNKKTQVSMLAFAMLLAMSTSAFAATGDLIDTTSIIDAFGKIVTAVIIIIAGVAGAGVAVMAAFLAWKFGKKAFNMIAG